MERTKVEDLEEEDNGSVEYGDDEENAAEDNEECGKQWEKRSEGGEKYVLYKKRKYRNVKIKENFKN